MIVYLDTSVIISKLFQQENQLEDWGNWEKAYTSSLCRVEFFRAADRLRLENKIDDGERAELTSQFHLIWRSLHKILITDSILQKASGPFSTVLGTLDAIHLASALIISPSGTETMLTFLTHDTQLGRAAKNCEYAVIGL